ncbi:MAG: iron ABC transporter permease [Solirubrobacterales bacterium]|nr:iron ABC transporter permease [Solirubrobacterales bacterium]MCB0861043.1 iron ABC transporter permease [Solirubrobacterales bacterium]
MLLALVAATCASLAFGPVHIPLGEVIDTLLGRQVPETSKQIIEVLRLPRTVEAIVVGAALGVAGALLQGALNNPLASPDVIGVTGGAGFGAMLVILLSPASVALLPLSALAFGLLAATLVFLIGFTGRGGGNITRIILAGIAIAALFSAATAGLMSAYPDRVPNAIFFLVGGLTSTGWDNLQTIWPYFAVGFVIAAFMIRPLDKLMLGDDVAASLGSRPRLIRLTAAFGAAILASAAAAIAGLLAFLGLLIPHLVRLLGGTNSHTYVIPVSALAGAALLTAADTMARTIAAPVEMPVGPFIVLLGVPLFLWLLRKAV